MRPELPINVGRAPDGQMLGRKALTFATAAHEAVGQVRPYTGEPYITHPVDVAEVAATASAAHRSPEANAAALLHDVVEDTKVRIETIVREFGPVVGTYVYHLSHAARKPEDGGHSARVAIDLMHMGTLTAREATIKVADIAVNTATIAGRAEPEVARRYLREKATALELLELLGADAGLIEDARERIARGERTLAEQNA